MILQGLVLMAGYLYTIGGADRARNYLAGHAARYPQQQGMFLPGLGHNAHVESPHLTIKVLDPYR
jgi:hypothetical protein